MKKTLSILFSALAIIYTLYVVFLGFTSPDSIHYTQMYIMCALMTAASLSIIFGAFESIDQERAGK